MAFKKMRHDPVDWRSDKDSQRLSRRVKWLRLSVNVLFHFALFLLPRQVWKERKVRFGSCEHQKQAAALIVALRLDLGDTLI